MADEQENIKLHFDSNAKTVAGDVNKLGASIESTTASTNENNQAVEQGEQTYKTFKTQLREANQELQKSIQLYGETSAETVKAAKAVANLKDQMGFAQDLADKFNPDQKMKALGAATQVAGTGLQGVTAGMALFGGESEDTQKQLLKVQAAMAFSDAISNLSNLGDQWKLLKTTIQSSSIATKANTAATGAAAMIQNLFTGSVTTTSAGFKALKFAIAATGIGLLVVGVGLLVSNFDKVKKVVLNLVPGLAAVGDMVMSIVNAVTDFIGVTSEADRALDRMKANADASLALNKKFLAEHGSQLDEFTKQKIEAKNKYNEAIKEDGADQVALAKELNRELAKIEYSRGDDARKIQAENEEKSREEAKARAKKKIQEEKDRIKEIGELKISEEQKALFELQDLNDKTEEEKLARQKERDLAEIEALKKKGVDVSNLLIYNNELYTTLEQELADKRLEEELKYEKIRNEGKNQLILDQKQWEIENETDPILKGQKELEFIDLKYQVEKEKLEEQLAEKNVSQEEQIKRQNELDQLNLDYKQSVADKEKEIEDGKIQAKKAQQDSLNALGNAGINAAKDLFGKNKAVQKGVIVAESAVALGKLATGVVEQVGEDNTASPLTFGMPWSGIHIATGALGAASIIANTTKQLQALGGGSAPTAGSTGGATRSAIAPPVVAFNNTAENQIGQSVAKTQAEQPPLQVIVAESDITNAQNNVKVLENKNKF